MVIGISSLARVASAVIAESPDGQWPTTGDNYSLSSARPVAPQVDIVEAFRRRVERLFGESLMVEKAASTSNSLVSQISGNGSPQQEAAKKTPHTGDYNDEYGDAVGGCSGPGAY